jgi:hypothetical protein
MLTPRSKDENILLRGEQDVVKILKYHDKQIITHQLIFDAVRGVKDTIFMSCTSGTAVKVVTKTTK